MNTCVPSLSDGKYAHSQIDGKWEDGQLKTRCNSIAKKMLAMIILFAILLGVTACTKDSESLVRTPDSLSAAGGSSTAEPEPIPSTPASELVAALGVGWNLGNTLDSCDFKKKGILSELTGISPEQYYETYWGNPVTTYEMIKAVADAGFGSVRLPVTFYDHIDEEGNISEAWLRRVEEVVNYVLDNDMYCIINLHHDAGANTWLKADPDNAEPMRNALRTVWLQIAEHFQDYDNRLLFEGFNEILDKENNWSKSSPAAYDMVNQLNQVFVDTVRSTQGCNKERFLIVNPYAAGGSEELLKAFVLPRDSIDGHLIVGIHSYSPVLFTWVQENVSWAKTYDNWDDQIGGLEIEQRLKDINKYLIKKGIPVILSEFAAWNKSNTGDRADYAVYFIRAAKKYNITCFWWDDGGRFESIDEISTTTLLNRLTNEWFFPEIVEAMVEAAK